MALTVNTNLASLTAQNSISQNQGALSTAMQRLSTGLQINSAADNAAGYAISQRMTAQINGTNQAASNSNDAISLTQTAQGDLGNITASLQQIRTLAVQAANGTNSASDRAALNNQAQQLISEITRVAGSSSFNGVNLLDGSFTGKNFQVGANSSANNTITIGSIANATASTLGVSSKTVTGSLTGTTATGGGLAAGDLTLNGIQVGATQIGENPGQATGSAVQIAAAINLASGQSGVTAVANAAVLAGGAATTFAAIASSADLTVNGIQVGNIAAGVTAAGQGANVANAINLVSSQSGVTATANTVTGAVTLTAADGSNIGLGTGFTAANSGLIGAGATGTQTATVTGAAVGTTAVNLAAGGLTINGVAVGAVTASATAATQQANIMAAINAISSQSGVTATNVAGAIKLTSTNNAGIVLGGTETNANILLDTGLVGGATAVTTTAATTVASQFTAISGSTPGLTVNGVQVGNIAAGGTVAGQGAAVAAAINLVSSKSGVTATSNATTGAISLSNASGGAITLGAGFTLAGTGLVAASNNAAGTATTGTISLASTDGSTIVVGGANVAAAGLTAGAQSTTLSTSTLSNVSLATATGASAALAVVDGALNQINASSAALGAYQNRFTATISTLQTDNVNSTASRSRITDANFAAETANLSRAQVIQQAATAMLAQANQSSQGVLSLLR